MKRWRRAKLFKVTRVEQVQVAFFVEATSALKARRTPTPADAVRLRIGETVGETAEQYARRTTGGGWNVGGRDVVYSRATDEHGDRLNGSQAANSGGRDYSPVDGDLVELQLNDPRFR